MLICFEGHISFNEYESRGYYGDEQIGYQSQINTWLLEQNEITDSGKH